MKVCLYLEFERFIKQESGLGVALAHQKRALELNGMPYTTDVRDQYDILHVNFMGPRTWRLVQWARKAGKRVILHIHTTPEDFMNSFTGSRWIAKLSIPLFKKYVSFGDIVLVPSIYTKNLLQNKYQVKTPVLVVSNGIEMQRIHDRLKKVQNFKSCYNIKKRMVLGMGMVFARKGIGDFIEVAKSFPSVSFLWAGKKLNPLLRWNGRMHHALSHLPKNVQFPGFINDKWAALASSDIFFFPSFEENQGIVVLEAASMGKPIVLRDIPVYRTYLHPEKDCLLGNTIGEFKRHIQRILEDAKLRDDLSWHAEQTAKQHDLRCIGKKYRELYQRLTQ